MALQMNRHPLIGHFLNSKVTVFGFGSFASGSLGCLPDGFEAVAVVVVAEEEAVASGGGGAVLPFGVVTLAVVDAGVAVIRGLAAFDVVWSLDGGNGGGVAVAVEVEGVGADKVAVIVEGGATISGSAATSFGGAFGMARAFETVLLNRSENGFCLI
jgi:hypothetical protein